jgi:hypothetical protein
MLDGAVTFTVPQLNVTAVTASFPTTVGQLNEVPDAPGSEQVGSAMFRAIC